MTGSMTSLSDLTCAADQRERGVQSQLTFKLSPESHKTQIEDLFSCLSQLRPMIEKSDAMLYAPDIADITDKCVNESLKCFMMELIMVSMEDAAPSNLSDCVYDFDKTLYHGTHPNVTCPQCEEYPLKNITIFLDRLNNILQKIHDQKTMQET